MNNRLYHIVALLALVIGATSCEFRPLYRESETPVDVVVLVDWTQLGGDPEGATILFYPEDQTKRAWEFKTNSVTRTIVQVPSGYYTVQVFNRTVDEFGSMSFDGIPSLPTGRAILDSKLFSWVGRADSIGRTVYEPEEIVVGRTDHFYVRKLTERHVLNREQTGTVWSFTTDMDSVIVTPKRMVYDATVSIRIDTLQSLKSARAYITGMAGSMYLATRTSGDTLATHVIEKWSIERDAIDYTKGYLKGTFKCFGLPEQYLAEPHEINNKLVLQLMLVDEKTIVQEIRFEGEKVVQNVNDLTVLIVDENPIALPNVPPAGGGASGFDVTFQDWGDPEDIPIAI